jgi:hypothetical protein
MNDKHRWRFFRAGGFDQVRLDTVDDLLHLDELDPKLWVALSCPVSGIEFDAATLRYLDQDGDGHVRVPELIAALKWTGAQLKDRAPLLAGARALPLAAIDDGTEEGRHLIGAARRVLESLGKGSATEISIADTGDVARIFAQMRCNGDGVITAASSADDAVDAAIARIGALMGTATDRSGAPGIDGEHIARFFSDADAVLAWHAAGGGAAGVAGLGDRSAEAAVAYRAVRHKVDDFFTRCQLAGFDAGAATPLNPDAAAYAALGQGTIDASTAAVMALPLARIEPDAPLPLHAGLNPAWVREVSHLRDLCVVPLLGARETLDASGWSRLRGAFEGHEAWYAARPATPVADVPVAELRALVEGGVRAKLEALVAEDLAVKPEADALASVDKLLHFVRDLATFANNFVAFRDFYTRKGKATFQAGTMYFDGRSAELCIKVADVAKHATLAPLSRLCLVYFDCERGAERMSVVAAFTAGDADQFIVGRNGVFYDRQGRDWRATIVKVMEQSISLRQAFWAPYKKVARFIGEQMNKFAAARAAASEQRLQVHAVETGARVATGAPAAAAPPPAFDVGKFAGIFAAIGLAIGAIGTAIASLVTGLLGLPAWKIPLVLVAALLLVSGPAMLIAWFGLRRRNLGPLLDASGWAVNARALINIPFGTTLTAVATLPPGSERALTDPYAEKPNRWPWYAATAALAGAVAWWWFRMRGAG